MVNSTITAYSIFSSSNRFLFALPHRTPVSGVQESTTVADKEHDRTMSPMFLFSLIEDGSSRRDELAYLGICTAVRLPINLDWLSLPFSYNIFTNGMIDHGKFGSSHPERILLTHQLPLTKSLF